MSLREQFEKEWIGEDAQSVLKKIKRFDPLKYEKLYSQWLEQRNANLAEVLYRVAGVLDGYKSDDRIDALDETLLEEIKQELDKTEMR
jgi:hypothetical protein